MKSNEIIFVEKKDEKIIREKALIVADAFHKAHHEDNRLPILIEYEYRCLICDVWDYLCDDDKKNENNALGRCVTALVQTADLMEKDELEQVFKDFSDDYDTCYNAFRYLEKYVETAKSESYEDENDMDMSPASVEFRTNLDAMEEAIKDAYMSAIYVGDDMRLIECLKNIVSDMENRLKKTLKED
jgi:hypothetical protein